MLLKANRRGSMSDNEIRRGAALARPASSVRRWLRQAHLYVGVAIAPTVLFFALTGTLQLFSLHEPHGGYRPVPVIEKLGMLHKDQVFMLKPKAPRPAEAGANRPRSGPRPAVLALKVFFLAVAVGLTFSTLLGLWMALTQARRKSILAALLGLGAFVPLVLVLL
jgi:hypothetical protein